MACLVWAACTCHDHCRPDLMLCLPVTVACAALQSVAHLCD
jgi:hypothetical protein